MKSRTNPRIIVRSRAEIPDDALGDVNEHIEESLGEPFSVLFRQFSEALPRTNAAIERYWKPLALQYHLSRFSNRWVSRGILESKDDRPNLVMATEPKSVRPDREGFDEGMSMLPLRWRELYRWFNAIGLESNRLPGARDEHTLPCTYQSRSDVDEYIDTVNIYFPNQLNLNKQRIERFIEPIAVAKPYPNGSQGEVHCWCITDQVDSLWICDQDRSGTVYHVRGDQYDDAAIVDDPGEKLDQYMALVLENGHSKGFDFRG